MHAMRLAISALLLLLTTAGIAGICRHELRTTFIAPEREYTPLYLPKAKYVKLVTLGYNRFASDILWFRTMSYFGHQFQKRASMNWLGEMCRLVTDLNVRAEHVYEFCGTLLSWVAHDAETSNEILTQAIAAYPNRWRFYYLRGFNFWYFLQNDSRAKEDFVAASKFPEAPPFVASLASRLLAAKEDPDVAITFLEELIKTTSNTAARKALTHRLKLAIIAKNTKMLEAAANKFRAEHSEPLVDINQLVGAGLVKSLPKDPFGGEYILDPATAAITTTSKRKGLAFGGRTAKTGLAHGEFRDEQSAQPGEKKNE